MKEYVSVRYSVIGKGCQMDEADYGNEQAEQRLAILIKQARKPIVKGIPGDCDLCGEWSGRLVEGVCAPCRDRYRMK